MSVFTGAVQPAWGLFLGNREKGIVNREGDRRAAMTLWESRSGADGGSLSLPRRPLRRGLLERIGRAPGTHRRGRRRRCCPPFWRRCCNPRPRWVLVSPRRNPPRREGAGQWPDGETRRTLPHREGPLVRREKGIDATKAGRITARPLPVSQRAAARWNDA